MRKVFNLLSLVLLLALALSLSPSAALAQNEVVCDSELVKLHLPARVDRLSATVETR
jgi:hypothetical protein